MLQFQEDYSFGLKEHPAFFLNNQDILKVLKNWCQTIVLSSISALGRDY